MGKESNSWPSPLLVVLLACMFMVLSEASSVWAFTAECDEPGTCVVLVRYLGNDVYCRKPGQGGMSGYWLDDVSGYDYSCEYPQTTHVGSVDNCFYPTGASYVAYYKWHWNGATWISVGRGTYYTIGDSGHTPLPPVPGEIVSHSFVNIPKLYPNGCVDLPSQQPDQPPNSDPGKPECNDQALLN